LDANDIHYREITVVGSIGQRMEDFWQAKKLVELNPRLLDALNVDVVPHDRPKAAFDRSLDHSVNRVLVTFD
jgi:L-iditol 2-dehydrogenase